MWLRKTEQEIKTKRNKISLIGPIGIFLGTFILAILSDKLGIRKYSADVNPKKWIEIFNLIPNYIIISIMIGGSIFLIQVFLKKDLFKEDLNVLICDNCNKMRENNQKLECDCGCQYYKIEEMKWKEER